MRIGLEFFIVVAVVCIAAAALTTISIRGDSTVDASANRAFTPDEIAVHNTPSDCWMAIKGSVYDVTRFVAQHPGGEIILAGCGREATNLFCNRPGTGTDHDQAAYALLPQFRIGALAD